MNAPIPLLPGRSDSSVAAARILVVDDSRDMHELIERILWRDGHVLAHAANGRGALRLLQAARFDLVLTDLFMPDMDGIELIRELTAQAAGTPIVVLSGADAAGAGNLLDAACVFGAATALRKPVSAPDLRAAVRAVLASRTDRTPRAVA